MPPRPSQAEQREHDASARSLLAVEEATIDVLADAVRDLGRRPGPAADELKRRLAPIYLGARRAARTQSRARVRAELVAVQAEAAGYGFDDGAIEVPALPRPDEEDERAADLWARGVSESFRKRAQSQGVRPAVTALRRRLELSGQATTADAWADERERVLGAVEREQRATRWLPFVGRLWDARLDACPVCRGLDGTIRPLGVGFPGDKIPGRVHFSCRCSSPIFFTAVYLGREEEDEATA
jgi:hypothetical protein